MRGLYVSFPGVRRFLFAAAIVAGAAVLGSGLPEAEDAERGGETAVPQESGAASADGGLDMNVKKPHHGAKNPPESNNKRLFSAREDGRGSDRTRPGQPPDQVGIRTTIIRKLENPEALEASGISDEESEKVRKEVRAVDQRISGLKHELSAALKRQADGIRGNEPDDIVMKNVKDVWRIRSSIAEAQMEKFLIVRRNLSPEQIGKLDRFGRDRRGRRHKPVSRGQ